MNRRYGDAISDKVKLRFRRNFVPSQPEIFTEIPLQIASPDQRAGSDHVRGMLIMSMAVLMLPLMDAVAKWLATVDHIPPAQVVFARFFVQTVLMFVLLLTTSGWTALKTNRIGGNIMRGVLLGAATLCFFTAIKYMPIADAIAVFFIEPLILTALSVIFLKEHVGWRRRIAVIVGFIGAVFVIQPSWSVFGMISLLPVATASLFAFYLLLTRSLSSHDNPVGMQMVAGVGGVFTAAIAMVFGTAAGVEDMAAVMPVRGETWGLLALTGILATIGHLLVVRAMGLAPASLLAPFQYLEIVTATAVGLLIFGNFPDLTKWFGVMIIVGSGLYTFWRERRTETVSIALPE